MISAPSGNVAEVSEEHPLNTPGSDISMPSGMTMLFIPLPLKE